MKKSVLFPLCFGARLAAASLLLVPATRALAAAGAPVITVQPDSQAAAPGGAVTFAVTADGPGPFSYQWHDHRTGAMAGATGRTLTLAGLALAGADGYDVEVSNAAGSVRSQSFTLNVIPTGVFNIVRYGAVADGITDNSAAITKAFTAAHNAGGGTVEVPAAFLPYMFNGLMLADGIASDVNFQIDSGATLKALPHGAYTGQPGSPCIIYIVNCHNVEISGGGTIDGNGSDWWSSEPGGGPYLITLAACNTLLIQGVTIANSPKEHLVPSNCDNVTIRDVKISCPVSANTDGMDPSGKHYLIENCTVADGDDNIVLKPGHHACVDFTIKNCAIGIGHGISIGGGTNCGVDGLNVTDCTFNGTTNGLRLKANPEAGGLVQNLNFSNLTMKNVHYPIVFYSYYNLRGYGNPAGKGTPAHVGQFNTNPPQELPGEHTPAWQNITINNLTLSGTCGPSVIWGLPLAGALISNITLNNVIYGDDAVFQINNAADIRFTGTTNIPDLSACNALVITSQPESRTAPADSAVSFHVGVAGTSGASRRAPAFRWNFNGTPLADGTQPDGSSVSGSATATLQLGNAQAAEAGGYTVTVSNTLDANPTSQNLVPNSIPVTATSNSATLVIGSLVLAPPPSAPASRPVAVTIAAAPAATPPAAAVTVPSPAPIKVPAAVTAGPPPAAAVTASARQTATVSIVLPGVTTPNKPTNPVPPATTVHLPAPEKVPVATATGGTPRIMANVPVPPPAAPASSTQSSTVSVVIAGGAVSGETTQPKVVPAATASAAAPSHVQINLPVTAGTPALAAKTPTLAPPPPAGAAQTAAISLNVAAPAVSVEPAGLKPAPVPVVPAPAAEPAPGNTAAAVTIVPPDHSGSVQPAASPPPAPHSLKGSIIGDVYSSPDQFFSIQIPLAVGSYAYRHMRVSEDFSRISMEVSFDTPAQNQNIYRVGISRRLARHSARLNLEAMAQIMIGREMAALTKQYQGEIRLLGQSAKNLNGKKVLWFHFEQTAAPGTLLANESAKLDHQVYLLEFSEADAMVWVQIPPGAAPGGIDPRIFAASLAIPSADAGDDAGAQPNPTDEADLFRAAADDGDALAQFNLAEGYANGEGVPQDERDAIDWTRKAADQGLAPAENSMGDDYTAGSGVTRNAAEAVKWYRKAAEQGLAIAQWNLGAAYALGSGVPKDEAAAVEWTRKAAEQGLATAEFDLGYYYAHGKSVPKDDVAAVFWYRKAAEQGLAGAQLNLGYHYTLGKGVPQNAAAAATWTRRAAEQGLADAQANLGNCYATGKGVPKDNAEAFKWYRKAAEQGLANAQFNLGDCYSNGTGVAKDDIEAVAWYRKAAEQGLADAQVNLGLKYYSGQGVPKDFVQAYVWWNVAGASGNSTAQDNLAIIEPQMTPEQKADAMKQTGELFEKLKKN